MLRKFATPGILVYVSILDVLILGINCNILILVLQISGGGLEVCILVNIIYT